MDVKDFSPNDLQVRVVDDRVVVEGKYEKVSATWGGGVTGGHVSSIQTVN